MTKFNLWHFYNEHEMIKYINDNHIQVIQVIERNAQQIAAGLIPFTVYGYKEII